jgi:hypothetical protein
MGPVLMRGAAMEMQVFDFRKALSIAGFVLSMAFLFGIVLI